MKGFFDILKKMVFLNFWDKQGVQSQWSMVSSRGSALGVSLGCQFGGQAGRLGFGGLGKGVSLREGQPGRGSAWRVSHTSAKGFSFPYPRSWTKVPLVLFFLLKK